MSELAMKVLRGGWIGVTMVFACYIYNATLDAIVEHGLFPPSSHLGLDNTHFVAGLAWGFAMNVLLLHAHTCLRLRLHCRRPPFHLRDGICATIDAAAPHRTLRRCCGHRRGDRWVDNDVVSGVVVVIIYGAMISAAVALGLITLENIEIFLHGLGLITPRPLPPDAAWPSRWLGHIINALRSEDVRSKINEIVLQDFLVSVTGRLFGNPRLRVPSSRQLARDASWMEDVTRTANIHLPSFFTFNRIDI